MTTYTATRAEDLIALAPIVLGFVPRDSLTMLTFGAGPSFHARIDLPDARGPSPAAEAEEVVRSLLQPARAHGVRRVVFVFYSAADQGALARRLTRVFEDARIAVVDAVRFADDRWFCATCRCRRTPPEGTPLDLAAHPFLAQAIFEGSVVLGSREELAAQVAADPAEQKRLAAQLPTARPPSSRSGTELRSAVRGWVAQGHRLEDADLVSLLVDLIDPRLREAAWCATDREEAARHIAWWTDVLRRAPDEVVAGPATVLAMAAAYAGDGALAWCALDRCPDGDQLAALLADGLSHACVPQTFAPLADWATGLRSSGRAS